MTLCKDQKEGLVAKLTAFFKGLSKDEIDVVVAEARQLANAETTEERKNKLTKFFESHLEKLKSLGVPQAILEGFGNKKDEVVSKMLEIWIDRYPRETLESLAKMGIYLGLPVIPRSYMGIYALMPMVKNGDKIGYTYLDPNKLTDVVETPKSLYYALDVEDGRAMLDKSPNEAEKIINSQKRSCLIADEVTALGAHTDVLSNHNVDATGSRCGSGFVPFFVLYDDRPKLDWSNPDDSNDEWGSASCGSRV
jgi:hypothetical protein